MTEKELCEKYPFLMASVDIYGYSIPTEERNYKNNWIKSIPQGWWKAFGIQMCEELLQILIKVDCVEDFYFLQIKEKFGELRLYENYIVSEEYLNWQKKYEKLSQITCFKCGKPATKITSGWELPVCDSCYEEIERGGR